MGNDAYDRSKSGNPIYRHQPKNRGRQYPRHAGENLAEIEAHFEKHIGEIGIVYHEMLSDLIHLDVLHIPATSERPYQVLFTSGVSDEVMNVPPGAEKFNRAELMIALPKDWPISMEAFEDEVNYWPVRWLKDVGRLPHEYDTWVGWYHTIPNGEPPEPIANTQFTGVMLAPAYWLGKDFFQLKTKQSETITIYNMIPLYLQEMELKLEVGAEELENRMDACAIDFVLDVNRRNAAMQS